MISNRCVITLGYVHVDKTTSEVIKTEKVARAEKLNVYQSRLNDALIQGIKVNGRYRVRDVYFDDTLNYVKIGEKQFRVNSVYTNRTSHFIEIEIGERYRGN